MPVPVPVSCVLFLVLGTQARELTEVVLEFRQANGENLTKIFATKWHVNKLQRFVVSLSLFFRENGYGEILDKGYRVVGERFPPAFCLCGLCLELQKRTTNELTFLVDNNFHHDDCHYDYCHFG